MLDARDFQYNFGALLAGINRTDDPALNRALTVHRNTAHKAAQDALAANYPVVAALVGDEAFAACAHDFVEDYPPGDPRLCLYSAGFADYLANWPAFADFSYLPSVARLERLVIEALFAADADPLDPARLAGDLDPAAALVLHPATRIASFDCPAVSIWLAHQDMPATGLDAIEWRHETAIVTRPGLTIQMRAVDDATHAFASAPTLADAAAAAHALGGNVADIFAALLADGAFAQPADALAQTNIPEDDDDAD